MLFFIEVGREGEVCGEGDGERTGHPGVNMGSDRGTKGSVRP